MEAQIDYVCLDTKTGWDHYILFQELFSVCEEHNVHIKLKKCEFLREELEYVHFDVAYGWWTSAPSKTQHMIDAKIIKENPMPGVKSVPGLIRDCTFNRRDIHRYPYTNARVTNLSKKGAPWGWKLERENYFPDL